MRTRVKICCITSPGEARTAAVAGADAVGLVGDMPSGPGVIDDATARTAERATPPGVTAFLLTRRTEGDEIAAHARFIGVPVVQIVSPVQPAVHALVRRAAPGLKIVQVVHVEGEEATTLAHAYARSADALLLDSGRPESEPPELGGTGRRHDWDVSRRIVREVGVPVWLAGGITPWNAAEAIETVKPFGLDICTGVRSAGRLDAGKLKSLFAAVKSAGGA